MLPVQAGDINLQTEIEFGDYPTFTYIVDPVSNQVRGNDEGMAAMRQAVEIIMSVERYKYQIYTPNFGIELSGLIGADEGFVRSELKRRIRDAFVPDRRVTDTVDYSFANAGTDTLVVRFVAVTVFGNLPAQMEVRLQ